MHPNSQQQHQAPISNSPTLRRHPYKSDLIVHSTRYFCLPVLSVYPFPCCTPEIKILCHCRCSWSAIRGIGVWHGFGSISPCSISLLTIFGALIEAVGVTIFLGLLSISECYGISILSLLKQRILWWFLVKLRFFTYGVFILFIGIFWLLSILAISWTILSMPISWVGTPHGLISISPFSYFKCLLSNDLVIFWYFPVISTSADKLVLFPWWYSLSPCSAPSNWPAWPAGY